MLLSSTKRHQASLAPTHILLPHIIQPTYSIRTHRPVAEVPDPALQDDCPAEGGVDQAAGAVDEVGRGLGVYPLVGHLATATTLRLAPGV